MHRWLRGIVTCALATAVGAVSAGRLAAQGVTGSAVGGTITTEGAAPVEGASVTLRNGATGTLYTTTSRSDGGYLIDNADAANNYSLTVRAIGYEPVTKNGLRLVLGQRLTSDFTLKKSAVQLQAVEVTAAPSILDDASRTGPSTIVSGNEIQRLPLQTRNFSDLIQTSPQATPQGSGVSIAGQNNRFNNIQIDGGVNNDLFGLAASGTPGGQANSLPISVEAIQEFQIQVAPFDVRQGGFTGGLVNAITRSGTNQYQGSAFGYYRGKGIAGFRDDPTFGTFNVYQYGGTFSGPIVKDKAHFFLAGDLQTSNSPFSSQSQLTGNDAADISKSGITLAQAQQFHDILVNQYGMADPGLGTAPTIGNPDKNLFGKLDFQLSPNNRVEVSHNWVKASQDQLTRSPTGAIFPNRLRDGYQLSNSGWGQANNTNTTRIKWTSSFGRDMSNEFLAGGQWVRDKRDIANQTPLILVDVGKVGANDAWLAGGADLFSQGNLLNQNIYSVADNLSFNLSNQHRITVGTSDEFFKFHNVFTAASYGAWAFASLDSLQNGLAEGFTRSLPGSPLRPEGAVADFAVQQYGLFAQDQWNVSRRITLTGGVRVDVPYMDKPAQNPALLNDPNLPINTSDFPSGNALWSPRLGFNVDADGRGTTILRGGVGVFTGRPPYVWISNAFVGTGLESVTLNCLTPATVPTFPGTALADQPTACAGGAGASPARPAPVFFDPNFKFPQTLRVATGIDRKLPYGIIGTFDFLYTKTLNSLYIQDNNLVQQAAQTAEGRFVYGTFNPNTGAATPQRLSGAMTTALFHRNASRDRSYSLTGQLTKTFGRGLSFNAGYSYSNAKDLISLTSSIAFSNYQFATVDGSLFDRNLTTSAFNTPHKITISGTATIPWVKTDLSLIYQGLSGSPYTWTAGGDANADGISGNDATFVPADASQITLAPGSSFAAVDAFINSQSCLAASRGKLLERNSCRNPWQNLLNARLTKLVPTIGTQGLELSVDLFNVLNFIDHNWGLTKQVSPFEEGPAFLRTAGFDVANNRPVYRFTPPTTVLTTVTGATLSRWRMQFGARYRF
jgi:outer membrane receptor for ferrienterochelin and colicin